MRNSMGDYGNEPEPEYEEEDMVDNAAEPDADDKGDEAEEREAKKKITTKFLTKYERGMFPQYHQTKVHFSKQQF